MRKQLKITTLPRALRAVARLPESLLLGILLLTALQAGCSDAPPSATDIVDLSEASDSEKKLAPNQHMKNSDLESQNSASTHLASLKKNSKNTQLKQNTGHAEIEWIDLLPEDDFLALTNPPAYIAGIEEGSEQDQLVGQLKAGLAGAGTEPSTTEAQNSQNNTEQSNTDSLNNTQRNKETTTARYIQALASTKIRQEYNGRNIRIPGFIVPLEFDDQLTITTFFLVPFFGACIHVPPPPPNQIIYAEYEPGIQLDVLYDPFWINGTLSTDLVENDMATAAYSMSVSAIEPYDEKVSQVWGNASTDKDNIDSDSIDSDNNAKDASKEITH